MLSTWSRWTLTPAFQCNEASASLSDECSQVQRPFSSCCYMIIDQSWLSNNIHFSQHAIEISNCIKQVKYEIIKSYFQFYWEFNSRITRAQLNALWSPLHTESIKQVLHCTALVKVDLVYWHSTHCKYMNGAMLKDKKRQQKQTHATAQCNNHLTERTHVPRRPCYAL